MRKLHIKIGNAIFGTSLCILGSFMIFYSQTFPKVHTGGDVLTGPSFFPTIIGILMIALGIFYLILSYFQQAKVERKYNQENRGNFFKGREFFNFLAFVALTALYPTIINFLGFFVGTFLFCVILMKILQAKWINAILSSLIIVGLTWIIFVKIASVSFPVGIIFTSK